jgi:hypothetical protein
MDQQSSQQRKDATRLATFIERNRALYQSSAAYKAMVDGTIYFTEAEQQESMTKIGGQYQDGKFLNL